MILLLYHALTELSIVLVQDWIKLQTFLFDLYKLNNHSVMPNTRLSICRQESWEIV